MTAPNEPERNESSGREEEKQRLITDAIADQINVLILTTPGAGQLYGKSMASLGKKKSKKQPSKAVRVVLKEKTISLNIHLVVDFGKPIPEIARRIQNEAKALIGRSYPEYELLAINVWVDGVRFSRDSANYRSEAVSALGEDGSIQ